MSQLLPLARIDELRRLAARPPLETSRDDLVSELKAYAPPKLSPRAKLSELKALRTYVYKLARSVDAHLLEVGQELKSSANGVELSAFKDIVMEALHDNALAAIEVAIANAREEQGPSKDDEADLWRGMQRAE